MAIQYKMDPSIRKYLESMNAQIEEGGRMIKTKDSSQNARLRRVLVKNKELRMQPNNLEEDDTLTTYTLETNRGNT